MNNKKTKEKKTDKEKRNCIEKVIKLLDVSSATIRIIALLALIITPFLNNIFDCSFGILIIISSIVLLALTELHLDFGSWKEMIIPSIIIYLFGYFFLINYGICSNWYWFGFNTGLLFVIGAAIYFYKFTQKHNIIADKKDKVKFVFSLIKVVLYYTLIDLFYMSFIIDSIVWRFIFGGLWLIIMYYNISQVFLSHGKTNNKIFIRLKKYGLIQDLILGLALTAYLIFIIPNKILQTIILAIVAAVYGGLFTLCGVVFEIRNQEKVRKEEKVEKDNEKKMEYKPFFTGFTIIGLKDKSDDIRYYDLSNKEDSHIIAKQEDLFDKVEVKKICRLFGLTFENSDQSNFVIEKISVDGVESFNRDCIVRKNGRFFICDCFILTDEERLPEVKIYTRDILKNRYIYKLDFKIRICEYEFDNGKYGMGRQVKKTDVVEMFIKEIIELSNE